MSDDEYILKVEDIHKTYGDAEVLKGVSFNVKKGDTIVFIGPSGTGKSTLLRCINQLTPPDKGRVFLRGEEVTNCGKRINYFRKYFDINYEFLSIILPSTILFAVIEILELLIISNNLAVANLLISSISIFAVVRGGFVKLAHGMSSKPTIFILFPISIFLSFASLIKPIAIASFTKLIPMFIFLSIFRRSKTCFPADRIVSSRE